MKSKIASAEIAYQEIAFEQNSWCKKQLEIVIFNVLAFDWEDSQRSRGTWGIGVGPKKANEGPEGNRWGSRGTLVSWGRLNGSKLDLNIIILSWVHNYMIWFLKRSENEFYRSYFQETPQKSIYNTLAIRFFYDWGPWYIGDPYVTSLGPDTSALLGWKTIMAENNFTNEKHNFNFNGFSKSWREFKKKIFCNWRQILIQS